MIDLFCKSATLLAWIFSLFFSRQGEGKRARDGRDTANVRKDRRRRLKAFESEKGQNWVVKDTKRSPKSKHKLKVLNIIACLLGSDAHPPPVPPIRDLELDLFFFSFFSSSSRPKQNPFFLGSIKDEIVSITSSNLPPGHTDLLARK